MKKAGFTFGEKQHWYTESTGWTDFQRYEKSLVSRLSFVSGLTAGLVLLARTNCPSFSYEVRCYSD